MLYRCDRSRSRHGYIRTRNDAKLVRRNLALNMIVPTRFGLKYAPIPTLALEYEDDLKGVVDATGESSTSLYVYRDGSSVPGPTRKLHVVELPMLTRTSETQQITRQLQQDNGRFLAPGIVSEVQLKRLLDRLVQNLPIPETNEHEQRQSTLTATREIEKVNKAEESESELEESVVEGSMMDESVVEDSQDVKPTTSEVNPNRGSFVSHEADSDREDEGRNEADAVAGDAIRLEDNEGGDGEADLDDNPPAASTEKDDRSDDELEAEEDAKKKRVLRSDSDVSEEEVQSEELEYFSEDGSDEDSF